MKQKKEIPESVVYGLVQFYAVVLFECNEAEDYGPAMTLMNTAFTLHHEGSTQVIVFDEDMREKRFSHFRSQ